MSDGVDFGKEVGPLPLGAWVAVVLGGLGIAYYARTRGSGAAASTTTAQGVDPLNANGLTSGVASDVGGFGADAGGALVNQPATNTSPTTNDAWRQAAEVALLGHGFFDIAQVDSAIANYFSGQPLSDQQYAAVEAALTLVGPTPYLVPAIQHTPTVATITPPASQTPPAAPPPTPALPIISTRPTPQPVAPNPLPGPGNAYVALNPIPGDTSTFVVGTTPDGSTYTYGGSAGQASALVGSTVAPGPAANTAGERNGAGFDPYPGTNMPRWQADGFSSYQAWLSVYPNGH